VVHLADWVQSYWRDFPFEESTRSGAVRFFPHGRQYGNYAVVNTGPHCCLNRYFRFAGYPPTNPSGHMREWEGRRGANMKGTD
jgi:hypothetical protein